ncbi:MAG: hypothetical protein AAF502_03100 [Bacteroidota bacterium]
MKRTTTILAALIAFTLLSLSCKAPVVIGSTGKMDCYYLPKYGDAAWTKWSNKALSKYFIEMRTTEQDCHREFNSDLHIAMQVWRDRVEEGTKGSKISLLLGKPDLILSKTNIAKYTPPKDEVLQTAISEISQDPSVEYHIYFWRGWQDYLWFKTDGEKVIKSAMYYAYE